MPAQIDIFLLGVPLSFCGFMWSQQGAALPSMVMLCCAACDAGIAITPGSAAIANTTATKRLIRTRREDFRRRIFAH
jgi:hypothetical protein